MRHYETVAYIAERQYAGLFYTLTGEFSKVVDFVSRHSKKASLYITVFARRLILFMVQRFWTNITATVEIKRSS